MWVYLWSDNLIGGWGWWGEWYCIFCTCSIAAWRTAILPAETRYIQNNNSNNYYTPISLAGVDGNSRNLACVCGAQMYWTICKLSDWTYSLCSSSAETFYLIC